MLKPKKSPYIPISDEKINTRFDILTRTLRLILLNPNSFLIKKDGKVNGKHPKNPLSKLFRKKIKPKISIRGIENIHIQKNMKTLVLQYHQTRHYNNHI